MGEEVEERVDCVRRVSGRPGADGAPRSVVWDLEVGWEADGAMRSAIVRDDRRRATRSLG